MSVDNMSQYEELKKFLLTEYKLTPREYKIRFETDTKNTDETYTLFAAKLRNLLTYYLESRLVADHKTLIELLISDCRSNCEIRADVLLLVTLHNYLCYAFMLL